MGSCCYARTHASDGNRETQDRGFAPMDCCNKKHFEVAFDIMEFFTTVQVVQTIRGDPSTTCKSISPSCLHYGAGSACSAVAGRNLCTPLLFGVRVSTSTPGTSDRQGRFGDQAPPMLDANINI